ncbi:MAG: hypothetical protein EBY76_00940 [Betaproteobacteria bacterium]|nr:hypothetical protein [Betaproteobacteria bacterium]
MGCITHGIDQYKSNRQIFCKHRPKGNAGLRDRIGGIGGYHASCTQEREAVRKVHAEGNIDHPVDGVILSKQLPAGLHKRLFPVIDHMISACAQSGLRLVLSRDGCNHALRTIEFCHLHCVKANGASAAQDQHPLAANAAVSKDAAVRGHRRYAHAGARLKVSTIG